MREYGSIPPVLTANVAASIGASSGLGTGGGAGILDAPFAFLGDIEIVTGSNPTANGSLALSFASAPPALFIAGPDAFGAITQSTAGSVVTIVWTGGSFRPNAKYRIHYEPFVSS